MTNFFQRKILLKMYSDSRRHFGFSSKGISYFVGRIHEISSRSINKIVLIVGVSKDSFTYCPIEISDRSRKDAAKPRKNQGKKQKIFKQTFLINSESLDSYFSTNMKQTKKISKNNKELKKLKKVLIEVGLRIAKRGEGALFVIGEVEYSTLVEQSVPPFKVTENPKLLESLALMDGAVIIDNKGILRAYGAMIKTTKTFRNFGTRHSAALTAAKGNNLVMIVSEEDKKIRILKKGKMIMQIDALQKNVESEVPKAVDLLESIGAGTVGTIGTSLLIPTLGITLLPGIIIFGSAYYLGKIIAKKYTSNFHNSKTH